ncbi:MAG: OmpA family protein, partial [Cyclobacteriaceae bacterium]
GYVFQNLMIEVEGASKEVKTVSKTVEMKKLVVGVTSVLHNIYFDYGTAKFREESYDELNKLENMMRRNDKVVVEIAGHTDNVSSASFNKTLSQKRADAVRDFLVSKGISTQRVTAVGYGEERPMASNDDEKDGRELNRRVEFKVLNN